MLVAVDTETHLIKKSCPAPELVCVSIAYRKENGETAEEIYDRREGVEVVHALLDSGCEIVGHNFVGYDMGVLSVEDPRLIPKWFEALERKQVFDTMTAQMILDNATGELKFEWDEELKQHKRSDFSLARLIQRHLDENVFRLKKGVDSWRLRYHEIAHLPISEWDDEAVHYAKLDASRTLWVREAQLKVADRLYPMLPTDQAARGQVRFHRGLETIPGEWHVNRAAWGLALMSLWGVRTDGNAIDILENTLKTEFESLAQELVEAGLMRVEKGKVVKTMSAITSRIVEHYFKAGIPVPTTPTGRVSTSRSTLTMTDTPDVEVDPILSKVADIGATGKLLNTYVPVLRRGENHAVHPSYNPIVETFRTSCRDPNLQNPPRAGGVRQCFVARPEMTFAFCDYGTLEMATLAQVCLWLFGDSPLADALIAGEDVHVSFAAEMLMIPYQEALDRYKAGDSEMKNARQLCFHPDTEILTFHQGWKKIANLSYEDYVAQSVPTSEGIRIEWEKPIALTRRTLGQGEKLLHLSCEGIDLRVTEHHRMLVCDRGGKNEEIEAKDFGTQHCWYNAGVAPSGSWDPPENLLRLAVATQADGSRTGHQLRFGFTKQRKIDRMRMLLKGIPHREYISSQGVTCFCLYGNSTYRSGIQTEKGYADYIYGMLTDKCFDERWLNLSSKGRQIVLDELRHWDSHRSARSVAFTFNSMNKKNIDIIQAIAVMEGRKAASRLPKNGCYNLSIRSHHERKNDRSRGDNVKNTPVDYSGDVVCLSVPSSFVLVRDGGSKNQIPVVVGQSKIPNYGAGGGMGKHALVSYARGYGVEINLEQADKLIQLYKRRWNMQRYFDYCNSLVDRRTRLAKVLQFPGSGLYRGMVPYTSLCNSLFQHLAAMGAEESIFRVQRECWVDTRFAIYGCRPWLFAHDEIGMEIPHTGQRRHDAAMRLSEIMKEAMKEWCPDVPIEAEVALCYRWEKGAPAMRDVHGHLIPVKPNPDGKGWVAA